MTSPALSTQPAAFSSRLWLHIGGARGLAFRLGLVMLAVVAASAHVLRGNSLVILLVIAIPGALVASRSVAPLAIYAAAWFAFSLLRAGANDLGFPNQGAPVAAIDRWLGFGLTPTERLQHAFYIPGEIGAVDYFAIWVHTSYYVTPLLAAIALWWGGRGRPDGGLFRDYLRATLAVMLIGLALYALVPTSPPWLEATQPDQPEMLVHRITRASNAGETEDREQVYTYFTDPNPVAAMPSLHTAFTLLIALVLFRVHRWLGVLGLAYAAAMGFSLVYLGEHFLADVLAGAAVTVAVVAVLWRRGGWVTGDG